MFSKFHLAKLMILISLRTTIMKNLQSKKRAQRINYNENFKKVIPSKFTSCLFFDTKKLLISFLIIKSWNKQ